MTNIEIKKIQIKVLLNRKNRNNVMLCKLYAIIDQVFTNAMQPQLKASCCKSHKAVDS